ncbi:MAG: TetR/AcrR family transcriptional regulator [Frankia sp.]
MPESEATRAEPGSARWWTERAAAAGRRRPRAGGLTTERIVETALEVLREGGLDALTLRALANRLGSSRVSNASLYRHIASRDELIVLIVDHLMGQVRLEPTGRGWRADVEALMRDIRRVILIQTLPTSVTRSRSAYGPNMLRVVDAVLGLFLGAGLTNQQAAFATTTMIEFVANATTIERTIAGHRPPGAIAAAGFDELLDTLPAGQFTALRTAGADYMAASADDVFTRGMAIVLDGIASQLGPPATGAARAPRSLRDPPGHPGAG